MNILFIEMEQQNLQFMKKLVEDGHTVYTQQCQTPIYYKSFGITSIPELPYFIYAQTKEDLKEEDINVLRNNSLPIRIQEEFEKILEKYKIDLVINTYPMFNNIMHSKDYGVDFISCSPEGVKLETEKVFARQFAHHCGIKVPKIITTGNNSFEISKNENLPKSFVAKPTNIWASSKICLDKRILDIFPKETFFSYPFPIDYYIEEIVKGLETNISYIMSNGKWSFTFSESCDESKAKLVNGEGPQAWFVNTTVEQLTPEIDKMVRDNVVEYLNEAAKLGGTYEGSITQMLGEDGELYFLENNCRPYVNNTFPLPLGGDEYLDAFKNNPQKIGDCFTGKKFPKLVFQGKTAFREDSRCEYPFHLHDKYGITEPTSIEIKNDKHFAMMGAVIIVFEDEINMDFVNEVEKESDLTAYWGD